MPRDEICPRSWTLSGECKDHQCSVPVLGGNASSFVSFVYQDVWILTQSIFAIVMKRRCVSTHLYISILPHNSASLCLNFLLDACHESYHLHKRKKVLSLGNPSSSPSVFRYLFVYPSFASGVNNINVMVCCCRAGLNLHVSDDKYPKTKMLIVPTNQHSCSSALADVTIGIFTAPPLHWETLTRLINYPPQSPTGAGDGGVYTLDPSSTKL